VTTPPAESLDPLDGDWDEAAYWSTSNTGEAVPGVLTPLNWSLWERGGEGGLRAALIAVGALERRFAEVPEDHQHRILGLFHGRIAANVDFMGRMGDRLPATSGAAIAEQLLGRLPDDFVSEPTLRRMPAIAASMPRALVGSPRAVRALARSTAPWWASEVSASRTLGFDGAIAQFERAQGRFTEALGIHTTCVFATIQPLYDAVLRVAGAAGEPQLAQRLLAGLGNHAEVAVVADLWDVSHERLDLDSFLDRHGYHGPDEGEISAYMWRERPDPVLTLCRRFAAKDESESPAAVLEARAAERAAAERELLAEISLPARPAARFLLEAAARVVPLRGVGKTAYLQAADVARSAGRRLGELLADGGAVDQPDDAFMLTLEEIRASGAATGLQETVAARKEQREAHLGVDLPGGWRGRPVAVAAATPSRSRSGLRLEGIGASPGTVEGPARVVLDPAAADVEPGGILVAPYTDPSWAPIMFASAGLVVDIGGELSHAAVVARELGIPCVMSTGDGTRRLRDGDICRIDGDAGHVDVLAPAG
jgi:phosphohistidine swiveling domain-containing protein